MGRIVDNLKALFGHTIVHGGSLEQASELPSKVNFLKNDQKCEIPPRGWRNRPKHGSVIGLARSMSIGDWAVVPDIKYAQTFKQAIDSAHGRSSGKTKTVKKGQARAIYVWRVK